MRVAKETGRPVEKVIRQPASLTLWTYLELQDQDRIDALLNRSARFEEAGLTALATWNGKEFTRAQTSFQAGLRIHPDPEVEEARRLEKDRKSVKLLERIAREGKGPRRIAPSK